MMTSVVSPRVPSKSNMIIFVLISIYQYNYIYILLPVIPDLLPVIPDLLPVIPDLIGDLLQIYEKRSISLCSLIYGYIILPSWVGYLRCCENLCVHPLVDVCVALRCNCTAAVVGRYNVTLCLLL